MNKRNKNNKSSNKLSIYRTIKATFPDKTYTKLKFVVSGVFPSTNATSAYTVGLLANTVYYPAENNWTTLPNSYLAYKATPLTGDPLFSVGAPTGYSTWATIYQQYRVLRNKIKVSIAPLSNVDQSQIVLVPLTNDSAVSIGVNGTTNSPGFQSLANMPYSKNKLLTYTTDATKNSISSSMTTAQINGLSKIQETAGTLNYVRVGTYPSVASGVQELDLPWGWVFQIRNNANNNFISNLPFKIEMEMDTEFTDVRTPS